MKDSRELMDILEAYDLFKSYNQTALHCNCSPNTVKSLVNRRNNGEIIKVNNNLERHFTLNTDHLNLVKQEVNRSNGKIRANILYERLVNIGFNGSARTIRRVVNSEKSNWNKLNSRVFWPWIPEPGKWAQYDYSDGPVVNGKKTVLFHYYLPSPRVRRVRRITDQSIPNTQMALDHSFRVTGGVTKYVLTDNSRVASFNHVAHMAVINPKMVAFANHYGFILYTCLPYDPQSKGGVEAAVRVAKDNLCPKEINLLDQYNSLEELDEAIEAFNNKINSQLHSHTNKIPNHELIKEREHLLALPSSPYVATYGQMRKVETKMSIVRYNNTGYSVPPMYRGEIAYVREQGSEIVIVAGNESKALTEIARHTIGAPYSYVISDLHKDPNHPNGPIERKLVPANKTEAAFIAISVEAKLWIHRACETGTTDILKSINKLIEIEKSVSKKVICKSLEADLFNCDFTVSLIKQELLNDRLYLPKDQESKLGTKQWAELKAMV